MNQKITILTPVRISNKEDFDFFKQTMESYYHIPDFAPVHNLAIKIEKAFETPFNNLLANIPGNFNIISRNDKACTSFVQLIESVKTPYMFVMFADVLNTTKKDILKLSVSALEKFPNICQIQLGGHPIGDFNKPPYDKTFWPGHHLKTNTDHIVIYENGSAKFFYDNDCTFRKEQLDENDTIWISSMTPKSLKCLYPFPFWHTVMRTSVAQEFCQKTKLLMQSSDSTVNDFIKYGNTSTSISTSKIYSQGWPKNFECFAKYDQAFLNFACYLYMLGRETKPLPQFIKDHGNEIH